ncbi:hypothetical protein QJS04_geneDACA014369 [Acorus gramineus]|uniref:Uncharacterized protein n=1 Tax=Acorus gramineus TaxID=55184 RepID=A0AAV9A144_ACOGR|nr:hypothetical protein QJS04_geneDACA014369 [Acorus gramineus]
MDIVRDLLLYIVNAKVDSMGGVIDGGVGTEGNPLDFKFGSAISISIHYTSLTEQIADQ